MPGKKKPKISKWFKEGEKILRTLDHSVQTLTGSPIKTHVTEAFRDFANSAHEKTSQPTDNYAVLGVDPNTPPEKIKRVYKSLIKLYHEAGEAPNPNKMREINSAYDAICRERGWSK